MPNPPNRSIHSTTRLTRTVLPTGGHQIVDGGSALPVGAHRSPEAGAMSDTRRVTLHLTAQATTEFSVSQLWPMYGEYGRFGTDLASFTTEVGRRLIQDSYLCF